MSAGKMRSKAGPTKIERARIIRNLVIRADAEHGDWKPVESTGASQGRIRVVDAGVGWFAYLSSKFSRGGNDRVRADSYEAAVLLQNAPPREDDVVVDVYVDGASKVLSIGTTMGVDTLITMTPGPWEELFGLPPRPWPPAVARRLAKRPAPRAA